MREPNLKVQYREKIAPEMKEKLQYRSIMQCPKIEKICINRGVGAAVADKKLIEVAANELHLITGQKPMITLAKKSVSNFKLREKMPIGVKSTLRRDKMYEFLDRLINIALPRVRDFRGLSDKSFDGRGNFNIGIKEQIIFPEVSIEKVKKIFGLEITIVTTAKTDKEAYLLLKSFGMPLK